MKYTCTYNNKVGFVPIPSPDPVSTGINIAQLVIEAGIAVAPFVIKWVGSRFEAPARNARDFIKNAKPTIVNLTPDERLIKVIAYAQKISDKAIDVNAKEWILWYRQAYRNDYKTLSLESKLYWNNFIQGIISAYNNPNNMNADLTLSFFDDSEIKYNATPIQSITNTGSKLPLIIGGIGILFVYLLRSKK